MSGNPDRAWNDPPPPATQAEAASKSGQHLKLNKRVGFPSTAPPATDTDSNQKPGSNLPPPTIADAGAKSTSDMPPPPPPRASQDPDQAKSPVDSNDKPVPTINLKDVIEKLEISLARLPDSKSAAIRYGEFSNS